MGMDIPLLNPKRKINIKENQTLVWFINNKIFISKIRELNINDKYKPIFFSINPAKGPDKDWESIRSGIIKLPYCISILTCL